MVNVSISIWNDINSTCILQAVAMSQLDNLNLHFVHFFFIFSKMPGLRSTEHVEHKLNHKSKHGLSRQNLIKMCIFKVLKANRVDSWYTSFLGVLKGAESKSAVRLAQKWSIRPQNEEIQDGRHRRAEMYTVSQKTSPTF